MSGERLNVFATRMTLTTMKNRAKGAKAGHKLLKRKADALTMKFRSMAKIIKDVRHARALSSRPGLGPGACHFALSAHRVPLLGAAEQGPGCRYHEGCVLGHFSGEARSGRLGHVRLLGSQAPRFASAPSRDALSPRVCSAVTPSMRV